MSPRENILEALRATLTPILPAGVSRSRKEQLPSLPAIVITPESETAPGDTLGYTDSLLTVAIAIYAHSEIPDQAIDPVIADVITALQADPTLSLGSDVQIMPGRRIEWDIENYDDGAATLRLDITYRTYP